MNRCDDATMYESPSCLFPIAAAAAAAILCPVLAAALAAGTKSRSNRSNGNGDQTTKAPPTSNQTLTGVSIDKHPTLVPFFYVPSVVPNCEIVTQPPFGDLLVSLDRYHSDTSAFLASMTRMHEVARRSEWILYGDRGDTSDNPLLAANLRDKIGWVAECLEQDYATLAGLMKPFDVTVGLPYHQATGTYHQCDTSEQDTYIAHSNTKTCTDSNEKRYTSVPRHGRATNDENTPYDSASQIIAHIARDWASSGSEIRLSLYTWCIDMLSKYSLRGNHLTVLVPGSGLGRLAYEVSGAGYRVEANDVSVSMASVAYQFLNGHVRKGILHPFCFDFLVNEVDAKKRYDSISYPDVEVFIDSDRGFSYTLGDFVHTYASPQRQGQYSSVVTCFFIDTATNIYEYLAIIQSVLCSGGVWINVGPVQWHGNALIQPSGDELKLLLVEGFGFEILTWSVDSEPVNYRHDEDGNSRYTKAEAYLPIRFVARKGRSGTEARQDIDTVVRELRDATSPVRGSTAYTASKGEAESYDNGSNDSANGDGFVFVDSEEEADVVIEEVS